MNLSTNFTLEEAVFSETAVRFNISNSPSPLVLKTMEATAGKMEVVRTMLGAKPLVITSWFRCLLLNRKLKSSDTSAHVLGYGVDFKCPSYGTPRDIIKLLINTNLMFDQMIEEGAWVHISFDPRNRKQVLTAMFDKKGRATYRVGL